MLLLYTFQYYYLSILDYKGCTEHEARNQFLSIALVLILSIIGFKSLIFWNTRPDYQVLFSNLSQEDAGEMVSKLKEKKIPFQLSYNGSTILIPRDQVYDTRLSMAAEGLPKGRKVA